MKSGSRVVTLAISFGLFTGVCGSALTGCNKEAPAGTSGGSTGKASTVGVIDLDLISKDLGWETEMETTEAASAELQSQFSVYQTQVQNAWLEKRKAIGAAAHLNAAQLAILTGDKVNLLELPLSKEQKDEFLQDNTVVGNALSAGQQTANQLFQEHRARVSESYREAIKPSVRRVAVAAGVAVVIPANNVFYYDPAPSVDLSNQVVDDMRITKPQHIMPQIGRLPPPKLDFAAGALVAGAAPAIGPAPAVPARPTTGPTR